MISLVTDPDNFFDNETGIYVLGPNDYDTDFPFFGSNFWEEWERPLNFSLFDGENNTGFSIDAGIKIFGGWSRAHQQKSLSIFARKQYGYDSMDYPIFKNRPYEEYQSIVLRNSGNDWLNSNIRDGILTGLMEGSGIETQAFQPAVCYFNGEYWGIYNIREKTNEHLPAAKFNIDPDSIKVLELQGTEDEEYFEFITYVNSTNLSPSDTYNVVSNQMDIENFIMYNIAQIYVNNTDWPGNNIKFWKSPETKWRWILFDTDFGFGIWNELDYFSNTLAFALNPSGPNWPNPPWSTLLFRRLMANTNFKNQFVNQFADELNSRFLPENVNAHIDSVMNVVSTEIGDHFERWGADPGTHFQAASNMRNFANLRPNRVKVHILQTLELPAFHEITTQIDDNSRGYIQLNSLTITDEQWNGDYFEEVPIQLEAIPYEGYTFSHWSGSNTSEDPLLSLNMISPMTIKANFIETTSVKDAKSLSGIKLFPNPTSSQFSIEFDESPHGKLQIQLLDLNGRLVRNLLQTSNNQVQTFHFDLGDIPAGTYNVLIKSDGYLDAVLEVIKVD